MTKNKFYQMVDDSIVFFSRDCNEAFCEIDARLKDLFKGAKFYNPSDDTIQSAENVCTDAPNKKNIIMFNYKNIA